MKIDNAIEIKIPAPDGQYRLVPCKCGSDNVAYVLGVDERWRVHCFDCGCDGASATVRHEAQVKWNGGVQRHEAR